ncbi:hypothetical protein HGM15179_022128, partial [Zosterops borbonicus]
MARKVVLLVSDWLVLQVPVRPLLEGDMLHHSGDYHCRGQVYSEVSGSWVQHKLALVTVTVH